MNIKTYTGQYINKSIVKLILLKSLYIYFKYSLKYIRINSFIDFIYHPFINQSIIQYNFYLNNHDHLRQISDYLNLRIRNFWQVIISFIQSQTRY